MGLIWFSQILRILELQQSISTQLFDVINTTMLVLPSFLSPLMPFLLLLGSFFLNYKFNISNEIIILKQYFSLKDNFLIFLTLTLGIYIIYFLNNEIFSVNLYNKYKVKELDIRNNLKLGVPSINEFHIENDVSIFFEKKIDNKFFDVEAIIFEDGQFIKANSANIEIENKNYNIIFNKGERVILNNFEKSKTSFDKFIYSIENKEIEELTFDKEHFNTYELLNKKENNEFYYHGHNRIYQYFLMLITILISYKVFLNYSANKSVFGYYLFLFLGVLVAQLINSYLIFILKNNNAFNLYYYYLINFIILSIYSYFIMNFNENN